jgi:hypothetical protein
MQNIDLEELDEADMERITELVYLVVNTNEYRQRCQIIQVNQFLIDFFNINYNYLKERIKSRQIGLKTSMTNVAEGNQREHEFLPEKIERLPRRKRGGPPAQTTTKKESPKKTNGSGGSDGSGEEGRGNDQQKKEDEEEKKEEGQQNEKKEETAKVVERPPLVRIQFRNKESAAAFCQLFKVNGNFKKMI